MLYNYIIIMATKISLSLLLILKLPQTETHPEVFWVIPQFLKTLIHRPSIFLPFPFAENYLQEVPHPADDRYISQLFFG